MLGLEDYGSDSDSDTGSVNKAPPKSASSRPLPPSAEPSSSKVITKPKKKVAIGLPALKPLDNDDDEGSDRRPAKKARLESGAGLSALVSMLPAPKSKAAVPVAPQRMLGGGNAQRTMFGAPQTTESESEPTPMFLPVSMQKGKPNVSVDEGTQKHTPKVATEPAVDFFSLGLLFCLSIPSHLCSTGGATSRDTTSSASTHLPFSSAPAVPTIEIPEPTRTDEYPGYYQLPSGQWAAHDPVYYATFTKKWQAEYNAHVRALEKGTAKGFEDMDTAGISEVNAQKEMERAKIEIQLREERKAVTQGADGAPAAPNMKLTVSPLMLIS